MRKPSPLLPIFLIVAVDVLGLTIVLPLLPFYAEHFSASPQVVGLLVTTYALCQLISGPLLGRASDHVGRKPLLILSQIGTLIGLIILACAHSLGWIFLSRVIDGSTAGNLSLAQAYISDVTEPKNRAKSFGIIGIAFGLGFLIGPAISGFLSQFGYTYPIFAACLLSFTSIMATTFLLPKTPPLPEGVTGPTPPPAGKKLALLDWGQYAEFFKRPDLAPLLMQFFFFAFCFAHFTAGFALFAERRFTHHGHPFGVKEVGYVFAYVGFLGIILQGGLIGRLVKKFGEHKLAAAGFVSLCLGNSFLGFARTTAALLGAATVSSFGNGVLRPSLTSLITRSVGRHEQGVVLGLNQSLMSVAQITAPILAGFLINRELLSAWAWTTAAVALTGWLWSRGRTHAPLPAGHGVEVRP